MQLINVRLTKFRKTMLALALLCLLPLAAVLVSALLAAILGCELNEGTPQACSILGLDVGGVLQSLFVMGWMALMTLPILMGVVIVWLLGEAFAVWRARRREARAAREGAET